MFDRLFLKHPRDVGESYGHHFVAAWTIGLTMIGGGLAALMHGLCPAMCTTTGSRTIRKLYEKVGPRSDKTLENCKAPDADVAAHI